MLTVGHNPQKKRDELNELAQRKKIKESIKPAKRKFLQAYRYAR